MARTGPLLVVAAAVLWGTTGTAQALGPDDASSLAVGAARVAVGGAALATLAALRRAPRSPGRWPPVPTAAAAVAVAAYQVLFFAAVRATGVALGTAVAIGSAPVAAGVLGWAVRGERPSRGWAAATTLAVAGCGLVLLGGGGETDIRPAGVALALGAGTSYAAYTVAGKSLLAGHRPDEVAAAVFGLAGLLLLPALVAGGLGPLLTAGGAAMVLHLGLVATAGAYVLFFRGLGAVPVATAATLSLAEPLTAGLLGMAVLGERPTAAALAGAGLVLAGLLVLALPGGRRRVPRHAHRDLRGS